MKKRRRGIGRKVTVLLVVAVSCVVLLTGSLNIWSLGRMKRLSTETSRELGQTAAQDAETALETMAGNHLLELAQEKANYMSDAFAEVERYVHGIAALAQQIYENPEAYPDRAVAYPKRESKELAAQLLRSSALAEPTQAQREELLKLGNVQDLLVQYNAQNDMVSSTYLATQSGWMLQADYIAFSKYENGGDAPDFYEASVRAWFQRALELAPGETVYSDVIVDAHGGGDCIVCAQPVYRGEELVAVVGIGSYLETLNQVVLNTVVGDTGYAFLMNQKGQIVVSPQSTGEMVASAQHARDVRESENEALAALAADMVAGKTGLTQLLIENEAVYLAYAPLTGLGWSFGLVMPVEEVVAPAKDSQENILALTDRVEEKQNASIRQMLFLLLAMVLVADGLVSVLGAAFGRRITSPLRRLTQDVQRLSGGNLDCTIEVNTGDEVEDLGTAFNNMTAQLRAYIQNLAAVTAERERIRTELEVASQLQADMLPDSASAMAGEKAFRLHAFMRPAKEMGGDFYDFYLLDEDHLALVVADVSGKGVPAAMFMVVSRTIIRNSLCVQRPLAEVVEEINQALCRENKDGMFVTAWLGILTLSTGVLTYVNAGHCHPLLARDGNYKYLTELGGMMLVGLEDSHYQQTHIQLQPGDILFQYSDGVTEAHNEAMALYGEDQLLARLCQCKDSEPYKLVNTVWADLEAFRGAAEQFDDITMLAIQYQGGAQTDTLGDDLANPNNAERCTTVIGPPELGNLSEMTEHIEIGLQGYMPRGSLTTILLAVDEIYSNICRYSNAKHVTCTCKAKDGVVTLRFEDDGIPYNPLEKTDPDVMLALEDRDIGGLGIYLVKKQMDAVHYEFTDGKNRLTLSKKIAEHED